MFNANNGWLRNFCKRTGFKSRAIYGEKGSSDETGAEEFVKQFNTFLVREFKLLTYMQVRKITFNFDEFRQILKSTAKRSYIAKETIVKGKKVYKAGVTVLVGISANGFKFKPLVIGASKDPRCFRGINRTTLPVVYVNQASAWMTSEIFQTYFLEHIVPTLHEHFPGQKVVITLDSAKCHADEHLVHTLQVKRL